MKDLLVFETPCFVYLGPFMNSDGITPNTGLSLSQGDIWLTRNGNAFFSLVDASAIVHSMLGYYRIPLGSTDLGSTGRLKMVCNKATALPVWDNWAVVTSKVYNALVTGSDNLEVDVIQIEGADATDQIGDAVLDEVVEGTTTLRQKIRLDLSALTGLMDVADNGDGTHTYTFEDIGNTKDRIKVIVNDTTKSRTTITTRDGS